MDTTPAPRKRSGRPPKIPRQQTNTEAVKSLQDLDVSEASTEVYATTSTTVNQSMESSTGQILDVDGSLTNKEQPQTPSAERRRSSRKKIIKFDVRDLLNKNRKPHKIQIEARIDSNAPAAVAAISAVPVSGCAGVSLSDAAATSDLTSKQKNFIEKSAIFRRFSISEQQNKIGPLRPLPLQTGTKISLLNHENEQPATAILDAEKMAQARRLSRTQEIFNATMMKSKQNSSLIVAQMESSNVNALNISTTPPIAIKRKTPGRKQRIADKETLSLQTQHMEAGKHSSLKGPPNVETVIQKRRGRPPKIKVNVESSMPTNILSKTSRGELIPESITPEKAKNWQEYKACLKQKESVVNETESVDLAAQESISIDHISLDPKNKSEENRSTEANESKPRNFAAVSFLKECSYLGNDDVSAPDFIVAAVEEIITEITPPNYSKEIPLTMADENVQNNKHIVDDSVSEKNESNLSESVAATENTMYQSNVLPSEALPKGKPISRTPSSSESETNSERSNKPYKKGDKLRVSLKRLNIPSSPGSSICSTTSSTVSTVSSNCSTSNTSTIEASTSSTLNSIVERETTDKVPFSKRSKRLQRKKKIEDQESEEGASTTSNESSIFIKETENYLSVNKILKENSVDRCESEVVIKPDFEKIESKNSAKTIKDQIESINMITQSVTSAVFESNLIHNAVNAISKETKIDDTNEFTTKLSKDISNLGDSKDASSSVDVMLSTIITNENIENVRPVEHISATEKDETDSFIIDEITKKNIVLEAGCVAEVSLESREEVCNLPKKATQNANVLTKSDIIQNVSVETSTLLDILRTVQSNKVAATVSMSDENIEELHAESKSPDLLSVNVENFDTTEFKDQDSRSNSSSPQTLKKMTRRYERRNRCGDETKHQTLEETFAEITAQSSKEILDKAAQETDTSLTWDPEENESEVKVLEKTDTLIEIADIKSKDLSYEQEITQSQLGNESENAKEEDRRLNIEITNKHKSADCPSIAVILEDNLKADGGIKTSSVVKVPTENLIDENQTKDKFEQNKASLQSVETIVKTPSRRGRKPKSKITEVQNESGETKDERNTLVPLESNNEESLESDKMQLVNIVENVTSSSNSDILLNENFTPNTPNPESETLIHMVKVTNNKEDYTPRPPPKKRIFRDEYDGVNKFETHVFTKIDTDIADVATKTNIENDLPSFLNETISQLPSSESAELKETPSEQPVRDSVFEEAAMPNDKPAKEDESINESSSLEAIMSKTISSKKIQYGSEKISSTKGKKSNQSIDEDRIDNIGDENDESRSTTSTPTPKRGKVKKKTNDVLAEQPTAFGKKQRKKCLNEVKLKTQKPATKQSESLEIEIGKSTQVKKPDKKKIFRFLEVEEAAVAELGKKLDEKSAKKKRQKKLKAAFEAALNDDLEKLKKNLESKHVFSEHLPTNSTPDSQLPSSFMPSTSTEICTMPAEEEKAISDEKQAVKIIETVEYDPDPLKDIEKFIEDGVNLLKRGYKIEDSVDKVVHSTISVEVGKCEDDVGEVTCESNSIEELVQDTTIKLQADCIQAEKTEIGPISPNEFRPQSLLQFSTFETPADTPLATPTVTPPPKSPTLELTSDEFSGVRRSHRIKQITKTPKALVGRGLVRDKERLSLKDDVETKSHYTLDDHLTDLAEVEAKNAKFLKDMEERLSNFQVIKENEYKCERIVSREARKMICDCFLTAGEEERGELGCGEDCLNRLLMIECGPDCNVKNRCTNNRFQRFLCSPCRVFRTEKKGFGIMADIEILPGEFIMEYVGEVIDGDEFERRRTLYSRDKNRHYYFMALRSDAIIDATIKGNISRFINHSCDPNAETQKWTVNGELRIGFFSRKSIMPGEEITFDYQYQRYGREAQRCYCESVNCRGWIGEEPNSDEGEQLDEDSDEDNLAESLLDEDDDSDESVSDAEEVQKKLEIAAAAAKLTPFSDEHRSNVDAFKDKKKKSILAEEDKEDSKSKFKKLLSKMAEKVAKKKKEKQTEKKQRKRGTQVASGEASTSKSRYLEDPDIEDEVNFLSRCGLKNQSDTLRLSRLMVRAKLVQTRLNLLEILRKGSSPCRRLFLDYHGLRLLHGWMSEDGGDMNTRMALLQTLEMLPIANKTVLTDSKVYQAVRNWCGSAGTSSSGTLSPSDDSSKESSSSNSQQAQQPTTSAAAENPTELQKLASKLCASWDSLQEIFRIPKRERIEQMKEHEREADRQYDEDDTSRTQITDRYQRDRFGRGLANRFSKPYANKDVRSISTVGTGQSDPRRRVGLESGGQTAAADATKHLSKEQRREMFAAKVARDEAEKRLVEERREFETKCRFFGLDPKKTRPVDVPFCVNPSTGQWFSAERRPISTPPSYAHVQVPVKPKSTDPADYQLPTVVNTLPPQWKYAITTQGKIYYYHVQMRVPQWELPTPAQIYNRSGQSGSVESDTAESDVAAEEDSVDEDDEILMSMDQAQLKAYIDRKVELRRQQRYNCLVDERAISPRREEDRIYNQMEVRKYKENKEKIRKRKEEIRRKRIEALKNSTLNMCTLGSLEETPTRADGKEQKSSAASDSDDEKAGVLPIQDYLLSSDEEDIKAECNNSPLIDKIVQGDKIVDELDALTTKRALKRTLPPHREPSMHASTSAAANGSASTAPSGAFSTAEKHEHKKRKLEKKERSKKSKEADSKYRKLKEKFRCEIAGIIVPHLKPYRKDSCQMGHIQSDEDFNHLARKLTHFVMIKELKYCESVGQTLVVTESVKNKSREFIKKYMAKYGEVYVKPKNDPEFKDIPFSL